VQSNRSFQPAQPQPKAQSLTMSSHQNSTTHPGVSQLEQVLSYIFVDKEVAREALQLPGNGVAWIGQRRISNGNKRLAVLGDQALNMYLCDTWYNGGLMEGELAQTAVYS